MANGRGVPHNRMIGGVKFKLYKYFDHPREARLAAIEQRKKGKRAYVREYEYSDPQIGGMIERHYAVFIK